MASNTFDTSAMTFEEDSDEMGHEARYGFSLYNPAAILREWTLTQNYFASCGRTQTVWKFTLTLHRATGDVYGWAKIERIDSKDVPVTAHFVLTFRYNDFSVDYQPRNPWTPAFLPNTVRELYIRTIAPTECKDALFNEILVVLKLFVRKCH